MKRALNGLVLAGGRSRRMGEDKAALVHPDGRSLAARGADLLRGAGCRRVFLSLRQDQTLPDGFGEDEVLRDAGEGSVGPMSGILAAMALFPEEDWLVLACDLPRLDGRTLQALVAEWRGDEAFLAFRSAGDGLPEPLCAIYGPASREILQAALDADMRCPRKILIRNECRLLELPDPRALENANTPEEWRDATAGGKSFSVSYFGLLGERRGVSEERIRSSAGTPRELFAEISTAHALGFSREHLRVAVNDEFADWESPLLEGDRVAFLPPMSGG